MEDQKIRAAMALHWAASDASDFEVEHQIYREDAVLEYPQSGERIRGRRHIQASRTAQPNRKRFTVKRILGSGDLWITEFVLTYDAQPSYVVSIMELKDGKVSRETQYFRRRVRSRGLHVPNGSSGCDEPGQRPRKELPRKVLMVLTSHDTLGSTGRKTGFWLEELAAPYYVFKDAGAQITLASPKGGRPPLDPKSNEPNFQTDITRRFEKDADAEARLDKTVRLDGVKQEDYDTVLYPGGHGPMWDLADDQHSVKLLESFVAAGKVFSVVCHSTGALRHVKPPQGKLLVEGKTVTGFTNGEEEAVGLTKVVPFLVEDEMMKLGATFSKVKNWGVHTAVSGKLITGQNPASSGPAARLLIDMLSKKAK